MSFIKIKDKIHNHFILNENEKWTFIAQISTVFYGIIIFILQSKFINSISLTTWFIFVSIIGFTGILEFGINQLISRHITYINKIDGQLNHIYKTEINLNEFLNSAQYLNKLFSISITSISFVVGILYFHYNSKIHLDLNGYILWILCTIGFLLNNLNNFYSGVIQGINHIIYLKKIQIFALFISSLISLSAISFGIYSLVMAYLVTSIYNFTRLHSFYKETYPIAPRVINRPIAFRVIKPDLEKNFFNMIAYKLLTNGYFLILGIFLLPKSLNSFGITNQIFTYIYSFSFVWITANFPHLSALYAENELQKLKKQFYPILLKAIAFFISSVIIFILSYKFILRNIELKNQLLEGNTMYLFILYIIIEVINGYYSQLLIILNKLKFMYLSFIYSITLVSITYLILNLGYSLDRIFLLRAILSLLIISIPLITISYKAMKK